MNSKRHLACCGLLAMAISIDAAHFANAEVDGMAFSCRFTQGASKSYENGGFASKPVKELAFDIGAIDPARQTATISFMSKGGKATGPLKMVHALNATHFIEVVSEGFLNLTTVYDKDPSNGGHPAVHSRHLGVFGSPVVSQYFGTCKPIAQK